MLFLCAAAAGTESTVPVTQTREQYGPDTWMQRHEKILARNKKVNPDFVFIGDSITHYWGGEPKAHLVRGDKAWKTAVGSKPATNLGFGFDYVENALWRVENGELDGISPRVVVVLIGTNNLGHKKDTAADTARGTAALLELIQKKQPKAKILLLSVLPRREAGLAKPIAETNSLYAKLAGGRVTFFDVGESLAAKPTNPGEARVADPTLFGDVVHPNAAGYAVIAEKIAPVLRRLAE